MGETRFHWETSRHVPPRPHATRTRRSRATQGTELHRGLSACAGLLLGSPRRRRFCGRPYGKAVPSCVLDLGKVDVHVACRRGVADRIHRVAAGVSVRDCRATGKVDGHAAWVDSGRENRRLSMARSSLRGSGWAPNGPASAPGRAELPRAVRRALRRCRSRAGALPRKHSDHAGGREAHVERRALVGLCHLHDVLHLGTQLGAHAAQVADDAHADPLFRVRVGVGVGVRVRVWS